MWFYRKSVAIKKSSEDKHLKPCSKEWNSSQTKKHSRKGGGAGFKSSPWSWGEVDVNSKPAHLWYVPLRVCERLQRLCSHVVSGKLEELLLEVVGQEQIKARGREFFRESTEDSVAADPGEGRGLGLFWNWITGECLNATREVLCRDGLRDCSLWEGY